jgi:putative DNA primase/helicase
MTDISVDMPRLHTANPAYPYILFDDVTPELDTTALVQGLLKPESFVVTYGESGSGKTFEALYRDLCIASGTPYFGRETEQGLVVYLAAEGGHSTRNRVAAYRRDLFPEASFVLVPHSMDLLNADGDVAGLIGLIRHLEDIMGKSCVKVTQDTLARAMPGGNENSGEDMGALVSNADRIRHEVGCVF